MSMSSLSLTEKRVNRAEKFKELALEYLNENYDDTFTVISYIGKSFGQSYRIVHFTSEKYADYSTVTVEIYDDDDGGYYFVDNYYHCYMYDDAVAYFEDIVDGIEPISVRVSFYDAVYSDGLNGATSFAEWIATENCRISDVYFITQETLSDEEMYSIVQNIADNKIGGGITFITTSSVEDVIDISISDMMNNHSTYVESQSSYFINYKFEVIKNNW